MLTELKKPTISDIGETATIPCFDPATLEPLGTVPVMSEAEVLAVVAKARAAQPAWASTTFTERKRVLRTLLDLIIERQEAICRSASRDSGKTLVDAALGEVFPVCEKIRYTLTYGARDLAPDPRPSGFLMHKKAHVEYLPLGVVGVIAPWNFPFHNLLCPLVPALFAGNAVVTKVSEWTSWSAAEYLGLVREALTRHGHSPELVQAVTGYGQTGSWLVTSGVEKIFFTGSPQNGRKVMEAASRTLTPVVLELGGKDPMIICDDADLDHAVLSAMLGTFTACGQMCVGAERIYVFAGVYDRFVEAVVTKARALRQGPPLAGEVVDCGAMTMPRQLDILEELVHDAVSKGARLLVGGKRNTAAGRGQFFEPTVLVDVDHTMRITQEEQFGPILVVMQVNDEEEAVRLANDCPYGLGSSVFSRDRARGERIASRIRAGMTVVNDYGLAYMIQSLPFGGTKVSGFGRINGREGLRACTLEKAVVTDRFPTGQSVSPFPVEPATFALVKDAIGTIYGQGLGARARSAWSTLMQLRSVSAARKARR